MPTNNNDSPANGYLPDAMPDPHGSAALLLVESLIHGLCEKDLLSTGEAVDVIDRAVSIQSEKAEAADGAGLPIWRAQALLSAIAASLRIDLREDPDTAAAPEVQQ